MFFLLFFACLVVMGNGNLHDDEYTNVRHHSDGARSCPACPEVPEKCRRMEDPRTGCPLCDVSAVVCQNDACCHADREPGVGVNLPAQTAHACCAANGEWVLSSIQEAGVFPECADLMGAGVARGRVCCHDTVCDQDHFAEVSLHERSGERKCTCIPAPRAGMCPSATHHSDCSSFPKCSIDHDCASGKKCCLACGETRCVDACDAAQPCLFLGQDGCSSITPIFDPTTGCPAGCDQNCCIHDAVEFRDGMRCQCEHGAWQCVMLAPDASCQPGAVMLSTSFDQATSEHCVCGSNRKWQCADRRRIAPECQAGDTKRDGCNKCSCSPKGVWQCPNHECRAECAAGETKQVDCRRCNCREGRWQCESRACGLPPRCKVGDTFRRDHLRYECGPTANEWHVAAQLREPTPECKEGAKSTIGCHPCECRDGAWKCDEQTGECPLLPQCKVGDTKQQQCNTCTCSADRQWQCTTRVCPDPTVCFEGDTKHAGDACNTLTCVDNAWVSSNLECTSECKEGSVKKRLCNTCTCRRGLWKCTQLKCSKCSDFECNAGMRAIYDPDMRCDMHHPCRPCRCIRPVRK